MLPASQSRICSGQERADGGTINVFILKNLDIKHHQKAWAHLAGLLQALVDFEVWVRFLDLARVLGVCGKAQIGSSQQAACNIVRKCCNVYLGPSSMGETGLDGT